MVAFLLTFRAKANKFCVLERLRNTFVLPRSFEQASRWHEFEGVSGVYAFQDRWRQGWRQRATGMYLPRVLESVYATRSVLRAQHPVPML